MILNIPWWGKIGIKLFLSRFPLDYSVWQRLGFFRHGKMDDGEYAVCVFNGHIKKTELTNQLCGKTLLELGPGDSIATAIIAKSHGARAILVDSGSFVCADIAPYIELVNILTQQGLPTPDLSACRTIGEILDLCDAQYMTEGLTSLSQIADESVDLIFSQAVLEHVSKDEFLSTLQECRRILKPNGVCSHQIDLRDHLGGALNHLRFNERVWESKFFTQSGFYTNRIRYNHMLELFDQAGFKTEVIESQRWVELPTPQNKLAKEFRDLPAQDLSVSVFDVVLR